MKFLPFLPPGAPWRTDREYRKNGSRAYPAGALTTLKRGAAQRRGNGWLSSAWTPSVYSALEPKSCPARRQQVTIAGLGHPAGARQVGFPTPATKIGILVGVASQDQARRLAPVGALLVGVEQA